MLIGKNSAIKGFTWFFTLILKTIAGIATISHFNESVFIGIIGIIATLYFAWEIVADYRKLEKESNEAMSMRNRNK